MIAVADLAQGENGQLDGQSGDLVGGDQYAAAQGSVSDVGPQGNWKSPGIGPIEVTE